jgi:hypothetical protein
MWLELLLKLAVKHKPKGPAHNRTQESRQTSSKTWAAATTAAAAAVEDKEEEEEEEEEVEVKEEEEEEGEMMMMNPGKLVKTRSHFHTWQTSTIADVNSV